MIVSVLLSVALAASAESGFDAHSNKARDLYGRGDLPGAAAEFKAALRLRPKDASATISLAGILMTMGKLPEAERRFKQGVGLLPESDVSLRSYCNSRLGDIALLGGRLEDARGRYEASLRDNPKDANAQIGLGVYDERRELWRDSLAAYQAGLALEPGNKVALEGLERVRRKLRWAQDPAGLLEEMRARVIISSEASTYRPDDLALLNDMRVAEDEGGVDFLKSKIGVLGAYVVEMRDKAGGIRVLFTKDGYAKYRFHFTQAAIHALEASGVKLKYLYYLEDADGKPLFDEYGSLSPAGDALYRGMRRGEAVQWKLPGQQLPGRQPAQGAAKAEEQDPKVRALLEAGYVEISRDEESWLERVGPCTESQLEEQHGMQVLPGSMKQPRYFLHTKEPLTAGVAKYRELGDGATLSGSGFFGGGRAKVCR